MGGGNPRKASGRKQKHEKNKTKNTKFIVTCSVLAQILTVDMTSV